MKLLVVMPALVLAGCAWLESVDLPVREKVALEDVQVQQLTRDALALRATAEQVRIQLASQMDRRIRTRQYRELRKLDEALLPLERQLEAAGRPLPTTVTAPAGT